MENKTFLKIPNSFFTIEKNDLGEEIGISKITEIGTEGFTIWCYLLMTQGNQVAAQTSIKAIKEFLNRFKGTRKKQAPNGLNDTRTIKKYLNILLKKEMIDCGEQWIGFNKMRADDALFIITKDMCPEGEGFSSISTQLFYDIIPKIGHIGWSIYCILYKNHNVTFGNQEPGNYGFANCSEEYIGKIINRNKSTISKYIEKFPATVVKTLPQKCTTIYNPKKDKEEQKYMPNHYIVYPKIDSGNKYYIGKA